VLGLVHTVLQDVTPGGFGNIASWRLVDRNGNFLAAASSKQLFGIGDQPSLLCPISENGAFFAGSGGGWYWNTPPAGGAVTNWIDAFQNWASVQPGFSSVALIQALPSGTTGARVVPLTDAPPSWGAPPSVIMFTSEPSWRVLFTASTPAVTGTACGIWLGPDISLYVQEPGGVLVQ